MDVPYPQTTLARETRAQIAGALSLMGISPEDADEVIDLGLHASNQATLTLCRVCETAQPRLFMATVLIATALQHNSMGAAEKANNAVGQASPILR